MLSRNALAKLWQQWVLLVNRGRNPEPLLNGLIKYAILWVRYDRRIAGRARNIDVTDYRSGMKQQRIEWQGRGIPDRSKRQDEWLDRLVSEGEDR